MESWYGAHKEDKTLLHQDNEDSLQMQQIINQLALSFGEEDINTYFSELELLKGVPLTYMVPDASMLPVESLRMFYVDPNWVTCLIDGGISIGRNSGQDLQHDNLVFDNMRKASRKNSMNLRNKRLNVKAVKEEPQEVRTGFLLNSQLVSGWPGLEVECYQAGNPLTLLRLERLTDMIMLCIVDGEIDEIQFTQPAQSIFFGFEECDDRIQQSLVSLLPNEIGKNLGQEIDVDFRDKALGVLDIGAFIKNIQETLHKNNKMGTYFSSVEFASQMVYKRHRASISIKRGL